MIIPLLTHSTIINYQAFLNHVIWVLFNSRHAPEDKRKVGKSLLMNLVIQQLCIKKENKGKLLLGEHKRKSKLSIENRQKSRSLKVSKDILGLQSVNAYSIYGCVCMSMHKLQGNLRNSKEPFTRFYETGSPTGFELTSLEEASW